VFLGVLARARLPATLPSLSGGFSSFITPTRPIFSSVFLRIELNFTVFRCTFSWKNLPARPAGPRDFSAGCRPRDERTAGLRRMRRAESHHVGGGRCMWAVRGGSGVRQAVARASGGPRAGVFRLSIHWVGDKISNIIFGRGFWGRKCRNVT